MRSTLFNGMAVSPTVIVCPNEFAFYKLCHIPQVYMQRFTYFPEYIQVDIIALFHVADGGKADPGEADQFTLGHPAPVQYLPELVIRNNQTPTPSIRIMSVYMIRLSRKRDMKSE